MSSLEGRTIVISGAGGGIGSAAVDACLAAGANVVGLDLPGEGLDRVATLSEKAIAVQADVTGADAWEEAVACGVAQFGTIDGLFNNAGIEGSVMPLTEYPEEMFSRVLDINVKGTWLGMKIVAPAIAEAGGGSIVNVSSVAGLGGAANLIAYSASKHAVIGMTKTAALELADRNIRCNAICPSPIQTRMMRSLEDSMKSDDVDAEALQAVIAANIPMGRYGEPSEVADLLRFLLSDDAKFMSGAVIPIDGAMKAR